MLSFGYISRDKHGFTYNELNDSKGNTNKFSDVDFSGKSFSSYYIHMVILSLTYNLFVGSIYLFYKQIVWALFGNGVLKPSFIVFVSVPLLFALASSLFIICSKIYRRKNTIRYIVTNKRILKRNPRSGYCKYMELSSPINFYINDKAARIDFRYRLPVSSDSLNINEVDKMAIVGVETPGIFLQTAANESYKNLKK